MKIWLLISLKLLRCICNVSKKRNKRNLTFYSTFYEQFCPVHEELSEMHKQTFLTCDMCYDVTITAYEMFTKEFSGDQILAL